jgi:hypothetical protein
MRTFFKACMPLFPIAVLACSAHEETAQTNDTLAERSICAPLDYASGAAPARDFYRTFDSDADAAHYLEALIEDGSLSSLSGADAKLVTFVTPEHPEYGHLGGLVRQVFDGFAKSFPQEMATILEDIGGPPRVAIIQSSKANAFALAPNGPENRSPWLFLVHTALLDLHPTSAELQGLFAHELGHLILRTFLPEIQKRVRKMYMVSGSENGILGAAQKNDPFVKKHIEELLERQGRVNGAPRLGFPALIPGVYLNLIQSLMAETGKPCQAERDAIGELKSAQMKLLPGYADGNVIPAVPSAEQAKELEALSENVRSALRAPSSCLRAPEATNMSLLELAAMQYHFENALDSDELLGHYLDVEARVDAEMPDALTVDRVLAAEAPLRAELATRQDDVHFPIDRLRVFDYEEDADDAAVRVLASIGVEPSALGDFFLKALMSSDEARAKCKADVAKAQAGEDVAIPFGRFVDVHPTTCWRYYHVTQFSSALRACTPESTRMKRPLGPSNGPSALDAIDRKIAR